eukprot:1683087-Alexandrium_andersonii.AAC.1
MGAAECVGIASVAVDGNLAGSPFGSGPVVGQRRIRPGDVGLIKWPGVYDKYRRHAYQRRQRRDTW